MTYDSLIDRLTADLKPVRRRRVALDILIVAAICAVELGLFFAMGAARTDMAGMMSASSFWWRLASLGTIALISGTVAVLSFNPAYSPRREIRWLVVVVAICLAFGLSINAGPDGFETIIHRLNWVDGVQCVYKMVLLSIPPAIGLGILMHRGAPTDVRGTAWLAGLAAAAWGAFVFVFACPFDDPLYVAVWYGTGCGIVTLVSRFVLPRLARW